MPDVLGGPQTNKGCTGVTAQGHFGWNALGELGMLDTDSLKESSKHLKENTEAVAKIKTLEGDLT